MPRFGKLPRRKFSTPARLSRGGGFNPAKEPESPLTGVVQNIKAAQGEERLWRTHLKGMNKGIVRSTKFRWTTLRRGMIGYKELDFLTEKSNGEVLAISVKGKAFTHFGSLNKEKDKVNEIIILSKLQELGYNVRGITTVFDTDLLTQEQADKKGRELGIYR